jgi:hypothetical protein
MISKEGPKNDLVDFSNLKPGTEREMNPTHGYTAVSNRRFTAPYAYQTARFDS